MSQVYRLLWVPGAGVNKDAGKPDVINGTRTLARCYAAFKAWQTGDYTHVMFSGGKPASRKVQTISEARLMQHRLLDPECPDDLTIDKTLLEERSLHSYGNVKHSMPILRREFGLDRIADITIVTSVEHYRRFEYTFPAYGFDRIKNWPVEYEGMLALTDKEREQEKEYLEMHRKDPLGRYYGTAATVLFTFKRFTGTGR